MPNICNSSEIPYDLENQPSWLQVAKAMQDLNWKSFAPRVPRTQLTTDLWFPELAYVKMMFKQERRQKSFAM